MPDRRQAFRREPIEIDLGGQIVSIGPISWEKRNDFGNELVGQHARILNEAVKVYVDEASGAPQLELKLAQKFEDAGLLLQLGLTPEAKDQLPQDLYFNQVVEILLAICDINDLPQLKQLIDPNSPSPTLLGGLTSILQAAEGDSDLGLKSVFGPDFSSPDSIENQLETSQDQNSKPSSET